MNIKENNRNSIHRFFDSKKLRAVAGNGLCVFLSVLILKEVIMPVFSLQNNGFFCLLLDMVSWLAIFIAILSHVIYLKRKFINKERFEVYKITFLYPLGIWIILSFIELFSFFYFMVTFNGVCLFNCVVSI